MQMIFLIASGSAVQWIVDVDVEVVARTRRTTDRTVHVKHTRSRPPRFDCCSECPTRAAPPRRPPLGIRATIIALWDTLGLHAAALSSPPLRCPLPSAPASPSASASRLPMSDHSPHWPPAALPANTLCYHLRQDGLPNFNMD